jgi:hypothetical protein
MNTDIAILNFSGIYEQESFYLQDKSSRFVDMKDISGTNCMCDDVAKEEILARIRKPYEGPGGLLPYGLHFIDNGNYHYLSALYLSLVKEPFSLVVLDHHPDMQRPMFDILSCGGWICDVIDNNQNVRDIHVVGADRGLISQLLEADAKRAKFYDLGEVFMSDGSIRLPETEYPVYLSIDKDVIIRDEIVTNWDQGEATIGGVISFAKELLERGRGMAEGKVLGIDICGECAPDQEECDLGAAISGNDAFNLQVLKLIVQNETK